MEKVSFNLRATAYPMPVAIVGATVNDKPNFMTVAWFSKVNKNPPMMMIAARARRAYMEARALVSFKR